MNKKSYTDPAYYEKGNDIKKDVDCPHPHSRHGKNLRGGVLWLAWGVILLLMLLYVRLAGLTFAEWAAWFHFGFEWAFVVIGAMIVVGEWRKGQD
jgi:hypothetical protein